MGNKSKKRPEREYITVICIEGGIITLIEPDGSIENYRQRGMEKVGEMDMLRLMQSGLVNPNWRQFKPLPRHYSISFEDEDFMGKAYASFNINRL